jgi:hypothetical protein
MADLEGAEAGGGSVHGVRRLRRIRSTEWSPAAPAEGAAEAEMGTETVGQVEGDNSRDWLRI